MERQLTDVTDLVELELHIMTAAIYFCDFSAIYPLINKDSVIVKAFLNNDLFSAKKLLARFYDLDGLTEDEWDALGRLYEELKRSYQTQLKNELLPLPKDFLTMLGEKALERNNFSTASTVFQYLNNLEKRINENIYKGIEQLKSKEFKDAMHSSDKEKSNQVIEEKIRQAASCFFKAMKLRRPISLDFQNLGVQFVLDDKMPLKRQYDRYVDQSVLRELIIAGILYLIHESSISSRILETLEAIQAPAKIMRHLLRELSILFAGSQENHNRFTQQYKAALEHFQNAENEIEKIRTQEILLGRTVGDGNYFQYLKELATQFPISPLVITCLNSSFDIKYIAPRFAKSVPLLELLGLDM